MLKLITPATSFPVSLDEAKAHLNVDFSDDDAKIEIYRRAATEDAVNFTGRAFHDQTWQLVLDTFPTNEIQLNRPPLIEVVSIKYDDGDGIEQTIDPASYVIDNVSEPGWVLPSSGAWPTVSGVNSVRIQFRAGYVDEEVSPIVGEVPYAIKAAILLTVGTLYAHRETVVIGQTVTKMPWAAEQLLRPYRVYTALA